MVLGKTLSLSSYASRYESNDELSNRVSQDINAIGFVGLPSVKRSKAIAIADGNASALLPNQLTVATEDYALSRRLYFYTADHSSNIYVSEFLDFVKSVDGQRVVKKVGFVSQNVKAVMPIEYQKLPNDFKELTQNSKRLTVNFRFKAGSAKLDNRALRDVERLVEYLGEDQRRGLLLIGFGDQKKLEKRSLLLSKLRAMAVRRELVRNGIYPKVSGYGDLMPVASNERSSGRMKNRRVEVWLRDTL